MFINGPINVVRLEGSINNINKIIYVFFDYHATEKKQTECETFDSINIIQYLYNIFKTSDKIIDFFMEIKNSNINKEYNTKRYIETVSDFYNRAQFKEDIKKNIKKNIRFHYLDIRNYLQKDIYSHIDQLNKSIYNIRVNKDILYSDYHNIINSCSKLIYELEIYKNFFENESVVPDNINDNKQKIYYYLNKIMEKYNNPDIIKKTKTFYIDNVSKEIITVLEELKKLHKLILEKEDYIYRQYETKKKNRNNVMTYYDFEDFNDYSNNINKLNDSIQHKMLIIFTKLTDLFFIRRFLDKDYINLAISYTGMAHSINYIYTLVSFFDFKITNYSFSEVDLDQLNKIAKTNIEELRDALYPKYLIQCSNLTDFPKDF